MNPRLRLLLSLTLAATPATLTAQQPAEAANPAVQTSKMLWQQLTAWITQAAEDVPETMYSYRPTPEVRTFGQLIGHVAGAQYLICAAALGDPARNEDDIERSKTTKADLIAALRASTAYCERAYAQTDAAAQARIKLFGADRSRLFALTLNATHNGEHYGNIVTYMRINKLVPPSSRPTQ